MRSIAWVLASVLAVLLGIWCAGIIILLTAWGSSNDILEAIWFAILGAIVAGALFLALAWVPARLYRALLMGEAWVRQPAKALGLILFPLGIAGLPVAAWSAVQGFDGVLFIPLFAVAATVGLAGPWLVVAGLRLTRLGPL